MKRPLLVLFAVSMIAAVAGWALAWKQAYNRRRDAPAYSALAEQRKAVQQAKEFAALVRTSDRVVISTGWEKDRPDAPFNDPAWIARFAVALGKTSCTPTPHGLWVSSPEITLYRGETKVAEFMMHGHILRVLGAADSGDFEIEPEAAQALHALIREKWSAPAVAGSG